MKTRAFSLSLFLLVGFFSAAAWGITVGQYEMRKLGSTGMEVHGVTLANGQIIKDVAGVPTGLTLNAAAVGLGSVENTALSTWAGSANVVTVGTITTGTWHGSVIEPAYLGTGSSITTKFLRGDGTWQNISSGLTIGTTGISGGTSGRLIYDNGGVLGEATGFTITGGALVDMTITKSSTTTAAPHLLIIGYGGNITVLDDDGITVRASLGGGRWIVADDYTDQAGSFSIGAASGEAINLAGGQYIAISSGSAWYSGTQDTILGRESAAVWQFGKDHATTTTDQRIKAHDVTTGTGAALDLAGGGGSVAGGAVTISTSTTTTPAVRVTVAASGTTTFAGAVLIGAGTAVQKLKHGVAVLVAGAVTISDSDTVETGTAATSSRILVTRMTDGGTPGASYSVTRVNATSFTITAKDSSGSTQTADTSTLSWEMINP